jgi:hypothetical protein
MTKITSNAKNTTLKLSDQVKIELSKKGYSFLFNYSDYKYYKAVCKNAFNKVQTIADLFIFENNQNSDFDEYIY